MLSIYLDQILYRQLSCPNIMSSIMLSIISTEYYVNLVVNYVVNYLDQILYRQFSRQLCHQLSRPYIILSILIVVNYVVNYLVISSCPFRGSVHLGANCCCQIYSTCSYKLRYVENFQIQSGTVTCVHFGSTFIWICALVSCSEPHCFVGDEI